MSYGLMLDIHGEKEAAVLLDHVMQNRGRSPGK